MSSFLEAFGVERGLTVAMIAAAIEVEPLLLERVDQGRQPLRMVHVRALAGIYGIQIAEAQALFPQRIESIDARLDNPKPPIPIRGDRIPPAVVTPTLEAP